MQIADQTGPSALPPRPAAAAAQDEAAKAAEKPVPPPPTQAPPPVNPAPGDIATQERRTSNPASEAAFETRAERRENTGPAELGPDVPILGEGSEEQQEAVQRAESAAGGSLSFFEKAAVVAASDDVPNNPVEPVAAPTDTGSYGAVGTPGAKTALPQLDVTA
ncbi:MAG: hypothetical protein AAF667_05795 [Pseudomonadota bacterium]